MQTIITNFLNASALNVEPAVIWALILAYVMLIVCTSASIWFSKAGAVAKLLWFLLVVACPFFGVILYCIGCLMRADYSTLAQMGFTKKKLINNKVRDGMKKASTMKQMQKAEHSV